MSRSPQELLLSARAALEAGRFGDAERLSGLALDLAPQSGYAKLLLALSINGARRYPEAAAHLRELVAREPSNGNYWSNLGTVLRSCGEFDEALAAYGRAAALGESDAHFWFNVGLLHSDRLELGKARAALARAAALAPQDAEIRYYQAAASFQDVEQEDAEAALSGWRNLQGLNADLLTRVGSLLTQLGDVAQAEKAFRDALAIDPGFVAAQIGLAHLLERNNRVDEARAQLNGVARGSVPPGDVAEDLLAIEARLAERDGDYALAQSKYRQLLTDDVPAHLRYHTLFPLARVHDAAGEYAEATRVAAEAHASQVRFLERAAAKLLAPGRRVFGICDFSVDAADVAAWDHAGAPGVEESPVFIVAFPRSGTTLLEQMLDAHPQLRSMDEQPFLQRALDRMRQHGARYPEGLARLTPAQLAEVRSHYWELVGSKVRLEPGQRLVDKNPLNLLRLPAIRRLFPGARILLAIRHPCDVLVSNYLQHYRAPEIAVLCRTLESLAEGFRRAFDYWYQQHALLAPASMELRYEDFVDDFERHARGVAQFLALPWHDAMLDPGAHARRRGYISTPSYSQVVQPVNRRAVGRWHNYAASLQGAIPIVKPYLDRWSYET